MSESTFFSIPCKPSISLRLNREKLTFYNEYCGRNVLTGKAIAQIGFDICENVDSFSTDIRKAFKALTGTELTDELLTSSKYAPVETKVFGIISENTAVYSLCVLLRDLLISTGRSDIRLRSILDKACDRYAFSRYPSFSELKEDLAIYLKTEVDEEIYGVIITSEKPLPEPIFKHKRTEKTYCEKEEAINFQQYSKAQEIWHSLSKSLTLERVQLYLAVFFIVFSIIAIPVTSIGKSHRQSNDVPTLSYYQHEHR